jgi:hypothetical protein
MRTIAFENLPRPAGGAEICHTFRDRDTPCVAAHASARSEARRESFLGMRLAADARLDSR